ncbi:MAG TPA: HK97 gp10 family phage protein [Candidatus Binataceae bacterium]|nr:HK97 gp10 family phage protein [Candidatus Binataceae bacterium]
MTISIGSASDVAAALGQIAARLGQDLKSEMTSATTMLREYIMTDKLSGNPLKQRTGELRNSIMSEVSATDGQAVGTIGTSVIYARIQEFGGKISARSVANLTIPLAAALGGDGVARFTARDLIANPAIGGFSGTFVRKQILFGKGPKGAITPLFKLQPSVELPSRSFFGSALAEKQNDILDVFRAGVSEAL